jgi:hypothetical protein
MLKECPQEVWPLVFGQQGAGDRLGEVMDIVGDEVGELAVFGMSPTLLDKDDGTALMPGFF